jgi:hypothetical protein
MSDFTTFGIDPGKHTGYAIVSFTYGISSSRFLPLGLPNGWSAHIKDIGTIEYESVVPDLCRIVSGLPKDQKLHVAAEKFVITRTAMIGQATEALEVTGIARAVLFLSGGTHSFDLQKPGDVKSMYSMKKLRDAGLIGQRHGLTDHAIDGLRHALYRGVRTIRR